MIKSLVIPLTFFIILLAPSVGGQTYGISGSFTDTNNLDSAYSNYYGQYLFVEAFSTTCSFCQNMHPVLTNVYDALNDKMVMLSISINPSDDLQRIQQWIVDYPSKWLVGYDYSFANKFQISSTPTMILFSPSGTILDQWVGVTSFAVLSSEIDSAIAANTEVLQSNGQTQTTDGQTSSTAPISGESGGSIIADIVTNPLFLGLIGLIVLIAIYFKFFDKPKKKEKTKN